MKITDFYTETAYRVDVDSEDSFVLRLSSCWYGWTPEGFKLMDRDKTLELERQFQAMHIEDES